MATTKQHIGSGRFPKQRLPLTTKISSNYQWGQDMIDYLVQNNQDNPSTLHDYDTSKSQEVSNYQRKLSNYQLYNNQINQADFERECNPLGLQVGQMGDTIKAYNKTPNKIQILLGEDLKRPFNYRAILVNPEGIQSKMSDRNSLIRDYITQQVSTTVKSIQAKLQGQDLSEEEIQKQLEKEQQLAMPPEKVDRYMSTTYRQSKEILANKLLSYFTRKLNIQDKKVDGFKHGLIAGEEFVWVGVQNGDPAVDVLNPLGVFYHKSPEIKYIQDSLYAGYRTMMTSGDIIDKFGEFLSEKDLAKLEGTISSIHGVNSDMISPKMNYHNKDIFQEMERRGAQAETYEGSYGKSDMQLDTPVYHVEWKSQKRVGFLDFLNEFGEPEMMLVSEDFEIPPNAEKENVKGQYNKSVTHYTWGTSRLHWGWIPEVWSGIRIGEDIYCCIGPKEYQYRSIDNPRSVKLGYHGLIYNAMNAQPIALMDRMKPFQFLYFVLVHKLKKLIAKDKGMVFHFDTSMVPEEIGLEKTMYYLEEQDIDFFNPLQNAEEAGSFQRGKITGSTSRSNMQHILSYVQLMAAIDEQISDVAGITRQREGQGSSNETVGNNRQAIQQSSHITEAVYFFPHDKLWEQVLNSLVQTAQAAWKDKKIIKQFILDDMSLGTLELSPGDLDNSDFGIFISNSGKENQTFQRLEELAQPLLQNDKAKFSDIINMFKASSIEDLSIQIVSAENAAEAQQQADMQQQQAMQQEQIKAQQAQNEDQQAHEKELKQMELDNKILIAQIDSFKFQQDQDKNNNGTPDQLEVAKFHADVNFKDKQLQQKDKELDIKQQVANKPAASQK